MAVVEQVVVLILVFAEMFAGDDTKWTFDSVFITPPKKHEEESETKQQQLRSVQ